MSKGSLKSIMEIAQEIMQDFPTKLSYDASVEEYYLNVYYANNTQVLKLEARYNLISVGTKDGVTTFYHNSIQ